MRKIEYEEVKQLIQSCHVRSGTLFETLGCHVSLCVSTWNSSRQVENPEELNKRTWLVKRTILSEDLFSCFLVLLFYTDQQIDTLICMSTYVSLRPLQYFLFIPTAKVAFHRCGSRAQDCTSAIGQAKMVKGG